MNLVNHVHLVQLLLVSDVFMQYDVRRCVCSCINVHTVFDRIKARFV